MKDEIDNLKKKLLDDLWAFGECATKTHIVDGVLKVERIDPVSPEFIKAMANSTGNYYPTKEMIERQDAIFQHLSMDDTRKD